jgi:pilin isopeptide linkage protein
MKAKRLLSGALALGIAMSMSMTAFAEESAKLTKVYSAVNEGTSSPEETFTFTEPVNISITDAAEGTVAPKIVVDSVTFSAGEAKKDAVLADGKAVNIHLADGEAWTSVGVYTYSFSEVNGNVRGVSYKSETMYVKVTVTNAAAGGYEATYAVYTDGEPGKSTKNNSFTNTYSAGSLTVTKDVEGKLGDKNKAFTICVTLTNAKKDGLTVKSDITITLPDGSTQTLAASDWNTPYYTVVDFDLKDGESVTLSNIPYGVVYQVDELDYSSEGYTTTYEGENTATVRGMVRGTLDSASESAKVINTKDPEIDTGISLDSLPYVMMLAIAGAGLVVFLAKKRSMRED